MGCGLTKKKMSSTDLESKPTYFEDREDSKPESPKEIAVQNCSVKIATQCHSAFSANSPKKSLFTVKEEQSSLEESGPRRSDKTQTERLNSRQIRLPSLY